MKITEALEELEDNWDIVAFNKSLMSKKAVRIILKYALEQGKVNEDEINDDDVKKAFLNNINNP